MKKLAIITAIVTASAMTVPAMADNNNHNYHNGKHHQTNASNHKYVKYNNGNAYGKYKYKAKKGNKYASQHYTTKHPVTYRHTATNAYKKWPVPSKPSDRPAVRYPTHR